MAIIKKGKNGMNQLETTKTLSNEERKQIISLLEKYSKEEIEMALRQLNKGKKIN
ncbi:hypothetical protein ACIQ4Z_14910 [Peribacillus asahii]|uniref:hypothetical protein n=1 Tax=Peribacillus asahii TaxID=228899 RepID=UPI00381EBC4E